MSKNKIEKNSKFEKYLQEEEFFIFLKDKKKYKKQRKQKKALDRSKYKKTDFQKQRQKQKSLSKKNHFKKSLVLSILGQEIIVRCNKKNFRCLLRGFLKKPQF